MGCGGRVEEKFDDDDLLLITHESTVVVPILWFVAFRVQGYILFYFFPKKILGW